MAVSDAEVYAIPTSQSTFPILLWIDVYKAIACFIWCSAFLVTIIINRMVRERVEGDRDGWWVWHTRGNFPPILSLKMIAISSRPVCVCVTLSYTGQGFIGGGGGGVSD